MKYSRYEHYVNPSSEWFGEVPQTWSFERLYNVAQIKTSNVDKKSIKGQKTIFLCNYVDVYYNEKITSETEFMVATASEDEISKFQLQKGDVVITKDSESPFDIGIPAIIDEKINNLICGYHLSIIRPNIDLIYGPFLFYALSAKLSSYQFNITANGVTRFGLSINNIKNLKLTFPEVQKQKIICGFLDQKTSQIDILIEKKKVLIEKLNEKRIALITSAVTKGLDDSFSMKDSGLDWLGKIPEHWEVRRIKFLGDIRYGLSEPPKYIDEGLPFIRATDIYRGTIIEENIKKVSPDDVPWDRKPGLREGEIIIVRSGAYTGDSAIVPKGLEGSIAGYDMVLSVIEHFSKFVSYALLSRYLLEGQMYLSRMRAAQPHLNAEDLGNFVILLPPIEEQKMITDFIDKQLTFIDKLKNKVEAAIGKLEEYKTAIISAAVTGKIKVS